MSLIVIVNRLTAYMIFTNFQVDAIRSIQAWNYFGNVYIETFLKNLNPSLLPVFQEDNGADWEHMRNWMVWCMHANLDESSDDTSPPTSANARHLRRQPSMDVVKSRLKSQQNFDVNPRDERMSAQSSLESNAET